MRKLFFSSFLGLHFLASSFAFSGPIEIDILQHEKKVYSEHGEDGIIETILDLVGTKTKYYVDIGAGNGHTISNTKYCREHLGWEGLLLDVAYVDRRINLHREKVLPNNVNQLLAKYEVPKNFDFLSLDIDGNDFYIWQSLSEEYRPRLVVVGYNPSHRADEDKVMIYNPNHTWDRTNYYGSSMLAMYNLARSKGYSLVGAEKECVNLFFVRDDLLEDAPFTFKNINNVSALYRIPNYRKGGIRGGHKDDYKNRPYVASRDLIVE